MYFRLNVNLSAAEIELIGVDNKEYIIKNEVEKVKDRYDYIIIDCHGIEYANDQCNDHSKFST